MWFAAIFASRVAPSDVIQVRVLNQPDLDTQVRVAPDGIRFARCGGGEHFTALAAHNDPRAIRLANFGRPAIRILLECADIEALI
jgi:hypothetical protein